MKTFCPICKKEAFVKVQWGTDVTKLQTATFCQIHTDELMETLGPLLKANKAFAIFDKHDLILEVKEDLSKDLETLGFLPLPKNLIDKELIMPPKKAKIQFIVMKHTEPGKEEVATVFGDNGMFSEYEVAEKTICEALDKFPADYLGTKPFFSIKKVYTA